MESFKYLYNRYSGRYTRDAECLKASRPTRPMHKSTSLNLKKGPRKVPMEAN